MSTARCGGESFITGALRWATITGTSSEYPGNRADGEAVSAPTLAAPRFAHYCDCGRVRRESNKFCTKCARQPRDAVGLIACIIAETPRLEDAACVKRPRLFDGDSGADAAQAISICKQCPALLQCRRWVKSLPRGQKPYGVIAGRHYPQVKTTREDN